MLFWAVILSVLAGYLIYRHKKVRNRYKDLTGPEGHPFLGVGLELAAGASSDYFSVLNKYWEKYGNRFRLFIGGRLCIFLSDPKDVEVILSSQDFLEKAHVYGFLQPWLGTGLLISTGEKWKKRRRVITPAFHFKILDNFVQVFNAQGDIFIEKLSSRPDNEAFDIYPHIALCALDVICETAMGVSVNAQHNAESVYVNAVRNACNIINGRMRNPIKRINFVFNLTSDSKVLKQSLDVLHGYTDKMIQQRRALLEKTNVNLSLFEDSNNDTDVYGAKKKMAFLDMLLLSTIDGKPLSDLDIREEVDTFLFEGHDTVSSALGFAVYLLSKHPNIQSRLFEEQQKLFSNKEPKNITQNDLNNMKYLELVIKESLRLYPPVPIIARKITEDYKINDLNIPNNSSVLFLCYNMNRNPEVFPEPDKFIPERFLPEESSKRNPFSSVFFSAGPRNCIGQKFAMLEMKSTLSKLVRNFVIESTDVPMVLMADLILKSVNGINVKLRNRKKII